MCDPVDSVRPCRRQSMRLLRPWARILEWVAISFSNAWKWKVKVKTLSRVWLCDPMDCSLPGSSVHGIFQAGVLEWVAIAFSEWSIWSLKLLKWSTERQPFLFRECSSNLQFTERAENAYMANGDSEPRVSTVEKCKTLTEKCYESKAQYWNMGWCKIKKSVSLTNVEPEWAS